MRVRTEVEGEDRHDGREKEHFCWSDDGPDEVVSGADVLSEFRSQCHVTCRFPELVDPSLEKNRFVAFGLKDERECKYRTALDDDQRMLASMLG